MRPRTLLYAGLICLVGAIMLAALLNRTTLEINVLHDRNPPYVLLSDGGVRNGYTVKILNKLHEPREFTLEARGLPGARLAIVGMDAGRHDSRHDRRSARAARVRHRAARRSWRRLEAGTSVRAGRARRRLAATRRRAPRSSRSQHAAPGGSP